MKQYLREGRTEELQSLLDLKAGELRDHFRETNLPTIG